MTDRIDSFPVVLGRDQFSDEIRIDLVRDASHVAVQGKTRSGKSVLTELCLAQCAVSPAVRVVGSDPSNTLLRPFASAFPHDSKIVVGPDDQERTLKMLQWVKSESDRRISKMAALDIDKFELFSRRFPLIVVVLEEYPGIVDGAGDEDAKAGRKPAERVAPRIQALYRQILAQSAKAGIRVITLAQRAEAAILGGSARSNIGTRITLRVDEPESIRMLHPNVTPEECNQIARFVAGMAFIDRPGMRRALMRADLVRDFPQYSAAVRQGLASR